MSEGRNEGLGGPFRLISRPFGTFSKSGALSRPALTGIRRFFGVAQAQTRQIGQKPAESALETDARFPYSGSQKVNATY